MLTFEQMLIRFAIALVLGALLGLERELVGKEAGIRTLMLVTSGAAIFSMIALALPSIVSAQTGNLSDVVARNSGFLTMIANIVVGIGFLGGGLIIKTGDRSRGVTTAALVWAAAAIGILVGVGLTEFAFVAAVVITALLYLLRKLNVSESFEKERESKK
jgi:putative Mg2+ transporter-C (MgtC) family protein